MILPPIAKNHGHRGNSTYYIEKPVGLGFLYVYTVRDQLMGNQLMGKQLIGHFAQNLTPNLWGADL